MQKIHIKFNKSLRQFTLRKSLIFSALLTLVFTALITNCTNLPSSNKNSEDLATQPSLLTESSNEFSFMSSNVENLFDTEHDAGKDDYTFLPASEKKKPEVIEACKKASTSYYVKECLETDWNENILNTKLNQIAKTFRYINNGQGPDIAVLIEVENIKVLKKLTDDKLKDLNYKTVALVEGPDSRGIDPAIVSKFPMKGEPQLHLIPYVDSNSDAQARARKSRGVIEVTLILPNKSELTVLAAHFPSQASPTEWRKQAHEFLKNKIIELSAQGKAVIAAGDLNTTELEERDHEYFHKILSQAGDVSHLVGCKTCEGSHFYKGHWSFLDAIIFGKELNKNNLAYEADSITTVKAPHAIKRNGTPLRFNDQTGEGFSDHLPLFVKIKMTNK